MITLEEMERRYVRRVLVACRASGLSWVEAARRANAGGAIKVTRRGPATAPTSDEIDAFLAVHA